LCCFTARSGFAQVPHGRVSRAAWYPTRIDIPHGVVSHTAWYPARHGPTCTRGPKDSAQQRTVAALTSERCQSPRRASACIALDASATWKVMEDYYAKGPPRRSTPRHASQRPCRASEFSCATFLGRCSSRARGCMLDQTAKRRSLLL
jgi:hypothetical protein